MPVDTASGAVAARRAKLAGRDRRLGLLYDEAVRIRQPDGLIQAMMLGHMVREIVDGLVQIEGVGLALGGAVERLDEMENALTRLAELAKAPGPADAAERLRQVAADLEALRQRRRPRAPSLAEQLADVARRLGLPPESPARPVANLGQEARELANGAAHFGKDVDPAQQQATEALMNLELFLDAVDSDFTPRFARLEDYLRLAESGTALTPADATRLAAFIVDEDAYRQFFLGLQQPAWLPVLRERGLLERRAPVEQTEAGQRVSRAWWPGEFLVKVAATAPAAAIDAYLSEAPHSDTDQIASVGRRIGQNVPAEHYSAALHRRILKDLEAVRSDASDWSGGAHEATDLVEHLNAVGLHGQAAAIVALLAKPELEVTDPDSPWRTRRTRAGIGYWPLSNLGKKAVAGMGASQSLALFTVLSKTIYNHLQLTYSDDAPRDHTYIHRKTWTDDDRGYEEPIHILLRVLYRECIRLTASGVPLRSLLDRLWETNWSAFRRLVMQLLGDHPREHLERSFELLLDPEQFRDSTVLPEYARLANLVAPLLRPEQVTAYCEFVAGEISAEGVEAYLNERGGKAPVTPEIVAGRVAALRAHRLAPLQEVLHGPWKETYEQAVAAYGAPRSVNGDVEFGRGGIALPTDLDALTPAQIIDRLRANRNRLDDTDDVTSDLYLGLRDAVRKRPDDLGAPAVAAAVPTAWVGIYFAGVREAVMQGWAPTHAMAAIAAIRDTHAVLDEAGLYSLAWAIREIAKSPTTTPEEMRTCITILEQVGQGAEDPPCQNMWEAADEVINRARTSALITLIDILARAHRDQPLHPESGEAAGQAMQGVVESWPADSPALACVLGQRFNLLSWLMPDWAAAHGHRLFDALSEPVRRTAWIAYVTWDQPWSTTVPRLDALYRDAIERFDADFQDDQRRGSTLYADGLGRQLAVIWYWGRGSPALRAAIRAAPSELAGNLLHELSNVLASTPPNEHVDLVGRSADLLDHYAQRARSGGLTVGNVYPWFRAAQVGHFDARRRLNWFRVGLEAERGVHLDGEALEAILRDAREAPEEGAAALVATLDNMPFYTLRDQARELIDGLMWFAANGSPESKRDLAAACDRMVRKGLLQYREPYLALRA